MSLARSRRKHRAEFKRDAVRLTHEPGRTVGEVATSLGHDRSLLRRWKSEIDAHGAWAFPGRGRAKASDEEVLQLRKDLARARQERDILKKALAYFAKERS